MSQLDQYHCKMVGIGKYHYKNLELLDNIGDLFELKITIAVMFSIQITIAVMFSIQIEPKSC